MSTDRLQYIQDHLFKSMWLLSELTYIDLETRDDWLNIPQTMDKLGNVIDHIKNGEIKLVDKPRE